VLIGAVVGLVLLVVLFGRQLARISRAPHPVLAAIEALALVVTMFLALFAFLYASLSADDPGSFTQPVGKVAGIYFSVTILATVGFGDISAVTETARIAVTVQMVLDVILIGVAVKLLGTSARRAVEARQAGMRTGEDVSDEVADRVVEAQAEPDHRTEG
jgi:voltage-gated potassium channel Kch